MKDAKRVGLFSHGPVLGAGRPWAKLLQSPLPGAVQGIVSGPDCCAHLDGRNSSGKV